MKRSAVVPGHALWDEGAAHDERGIRIRGYWAGVSGDGRAKCECRWLSDVLPSGAARKRAHAEHKRQVQEAAS